MENTNNSNTFKVVVGVLVVAVIAFFGLRMKDSEPTPVTNEETPTVTNSKYRDGTYLADGTYVSPAGVETVSVSLTIKDDVITGVDFTGNAVNPTSKLLQGKFATGFETLVEGKALDAVSLTVVNGSSLAPKGFMDALAKIKLEARS